MSTLNVYIHDLSSGWVKRVVVTTHQGRFILYPMIGQISEFQKSKLERGNMHFPNSLTMLSGSNQNRLVC